MFVDLIQAKDLGLMYYSSGNYCRKGHKAPRYTSSRLCTACLGTPPTGNKRTADHTHGELLKHAHATAFRGTMREAIAAGAEYYILAKPCKHGHYAPRSVSVPQCMACKYPRQADGTTYRPTQPTCGSAKPKRVYPSKAKRISANGTVMYYYAGSHVLPHDFNTGYAMNDATVTTSREGQEVFARSNGATACAVARNSTAYATVTGAAAKAIGKGSRAIAMARGAKAYSAHVQTEAIATVKGALLRIVARGSGYEDFIEDWWPKSKGLRLKM